MRKLYALFAGLLLTLVLQARPATPDIANFTFAIGTPNYTATFVNTSVLGNEPGTRQAYWFFGDGSMTVTLPLAGTQHHYQTAGTYNVCLKIYRFGSTANDSVLTAQICKTVTITPACVADFERVLTPGANPLSAYFKALPVITAGNVPVRICWQFGDGRDTCIQYSNTFTGPYPVQHTYAVPGQYEVCVNILYSGGCEARKCNHIQIGTPDSCHADFERIVSSSNDPLLVYLKALPQNSNNRKPSRVCWNFGDNRDTCINYPENFTGVYATSHHYNAPGVYNVCVKIQYFGGCEATKCDHITVGRPDTCHANFETIPSPNTNPLLSYFRAQPQHNNNRKPSRICWTFGDNRDTCINYPENYTGQYVVSHLYNQPGQYQVCVRIIYYGGCEASNCHPITIPPAPVTCTVQLYETAASNTNLTRTFYAGPSSTPARRPVRICWYFGDGHDTCINIDPQLPLPNFSATHTFPSPGTYRVCVKVQFDGGCIAENCKEVTIRTSASICGGYMLDSLIAPRSYKFKGFSIHDPNDVVTGYHWTFGDGTTASGQEVTHTYANASAYRVCLVINTQSGCETKICNTLPLPGTTISVLHLSPNPVINMLHVEFYSTHTEQITVKIQNSTGVVVRSYIRNVTAGLNNWDIDLSNLVAGIYSLTIQSPNQMASGIFIKQ